MQTDRWLAVVYDEGSVAPTRMRQAAQELGHRTVFVATDSAYTREMRPVLERLGPIVDEAGAAPDQVAEQLRQFRPVGILTFSERQLRTTSLLAEWLGLEHHPTAALDAITRKDAQRESLARAGVDSVRFHPIRSVDDVATAVRVVGLPAVLKPITGVASRNTFVVGTPDECRRAAATLLAPDPNGAGLPERELLLEELLTGTPIDQPWGDYLGVDCLCTEDTVEPVLVTSKFRLAAPFRERGGYAGQSASDDATVEAAAQLACRAIRAVGIRTGIAGAEIKLTPSGPRVIEVNGRLGGWVDQLARSTGHSDPVELAVRSALGLPLPAVIPRQQGPISFQYLLMPPPDAVSVTAVHDVAALRRVRNVERVIVRARRGMPVRWQLGNDSGVAAAIGTAHSLAELTATIDQLEAANWITYA
ncbi:hypothetical protein GCM10029976_032750 [Kribbella albertanoniae]|uniref:ATP-grasp domain-containing protein n=1 Tax=Kribbella albertanoniae TaxID=1266829 RepID=A0A4V6PAN5_9ACTN|nr:ATP-grasp domain-containing protein [Kribbella albertanoniae]TDC35505.1 ATP-grasp domain-containing protein [Kribbella albertanoniae]